MTVQFFLRGGEKCTDESEGLTITCQLSIENEPRDVPFSTRMRVPKKYWWTNTHKSPPAGRWVNDAYYNAESINRRLQDIERAFQSIFDMLPFIHEDEEITYQLIRQHFDPKTAKIVKVQPAKKQAKTYTLLDVYKLYVEDKQEKENTSANTIKTYRSRMNHIKAFFGDRRIDTIRHKDTDSFEKYMIKLVDKKSGKPLLCRNYRNKMLTFLKNLLEFAVKKEMLKTMPIVTLDLHYDEEKPPQYLTPRQREKLEAVDVPALEVAKDIAVFIMHTGFSYVDYLQLESHHLQGQGFKKQRHKTKVWSYPPLLPEAAAIIAKYGSIDNLPRPDGSDLNKALKFLSTFAGIDKDLEHPLCISDFRETFASMMENEFMLDSRVVMAMMGHRNPRQLKNYSRLTPERVLYEVEMSRKKLTKL